MHGRAGGSAWQGSKRKRTADRLELVLEVLAAGGGRVEVRLDHHANTAAASGRGGGGGERGERRQAGGRSVRQGGAAHRTTRSRCRRRSCAAKGAVHKMSESERAGHRRGSWSSSESSPTSACGRRPRTARAGEGGRRSASCGREAGARERGRRRRRRRGSTAGGDALVPLDGHAFNFLERQGGGRLPVLRAAQDQVVQRVADAVVCGARRAVSNGLAWTTDGRLAFKASESYSGRRRRLREGRRLFRRRAARAAGSRLQGAPGKWYVAA